MNLWKNRRTKRIIFSLTIFLLIFYFSLSLFAAHVLTSPLARYIEISPTLISEDYEHINFKTADGLTLYGWFFPNTSENLIIMVAGMRGNRHDTGYYAVGIAQELIDQGYNILMYDTRAHGDSEGNRFAYGANEGKDVLAAVDFAKSKGFEGKDIGIIGNSTGAVSILMVADQLKDIGAMVIDSAATDFSIVVRDRLWKETHIPGPFHPTILFFSKIFFGADINNIRPIDKLPLVPERKFLYLNTLPDWTTPIWHSEQLLAASNKESKLVAFPEGGHIETYKKNPTLYRKEVFSFLNSELAD